MQAAKADGDEAIVKPIDIASEIRSKSAAAAANTAPVFVVGCPRSGTTVLYHMLLSAGNFAVYRTESNVFNLLVPRFGGMRSGANRQKLLEVWLRSKAFRVSGLEPGEISSTIMAECHSAGDFLRIVMGRIAHRQGMRRWADCTPEHLLYMKEIKRQIKDALFIHVIRDGRDVALSYAKQGWSHPLPWDHKENIAVAGLYWEWMVRKGRKEGRQLGASYLEVRFEELISNPLQTLSRIGEFIGHDLNYERIQRVGIGAISRPNSSFGEESCASFNPVARWKTIMSEEQTEAFEALVGKFLRELGYVPASSESGRASLRALRLRATYLPMFESKYWMRINTALGRRVNLERIEIEPRKPA